MGKGEFSVPVVLVKIPGFHVTAAGGFLSAATFFHFRLVMMETVFSIRLVYINANCVYFQRAVTVSC
jgi:hypothetical protein